MRANTSAIVSLAAVLALVSTPSVDAFSVATTKLGGLNLNSVVPVSERYQQSSTSLSMAGKITEGNGGGVVITGSAGGVGFAYASEFLKRGYDVVICDVKDCTNAAKALASSYPSSGGRVFHTQCDVSDSSQMEALGKFAQEKLGTIGYWINNAGINGGRRALMDVPMNQVELVVKVNLMGILFGSKVAMDIMSKQVCSLHQEMIQIRMKLTGEFAVYKN